MSKSNIRDIAPLHRGRLVLQWHITDRCNLCCAHCYQEDHPTRELPFQDLLKILEQFKELIDQLGDGEVPPVRGHINVSGGEPFVRKDFLDLLETFAANRDWLSFGILTNGTFIDETMAQRLRQLKPAFVQVSIEGTRVTNDNIRGRGALERTVSALKHLVREHIPSVISFTAHRGNFREFTEVALLGSELGVKRVWADRLIPLGSGESLKEQMLSPDETREFFNIMYRAHNEAMLKFSRTEISMHRALQFLVGGGHPYHCGAGETLITVLPNGDLYPCRRMPIRVGNLMETPLTELYFTCDLFCSLRNPNNISDECRDCIFSSKCRGGLKCLSYAVTGDPFKADPGCWRSRAHKKIAACEVPLQS